jgi:hypothetical protein
MFIRKEKTNFCLLKPKNFIISSKQQYESNVIFPTPCIITNLKCTNHESKLLIVKELTLGNQVYSKIFNNYNEESITLYELELTINSLNIISTPIYDFLLKLYNPTNSDINFNIVYTYSYISYTY